MLDLMTTPPLHPDDMTWLEVLVYVISNTANGLHNLGIPDLDT